MGDFCLYFRTHRICFIAISHQQKTPKNTPMARLMLLIYSKWVLKVSFHIGATINGKLIKVLGAQISFIFTSEFKKFDNNINLKHTKHRNYLYFKENLNRMIR